MRILFDECVPRPLRAGLMDYEVKTVREMGWAGIKNGTLLRLAEQEFDIFLTVDRNMEYQQDLGSYKLAVIVLVAKSNSYLALQPLVPQVIAVFPTLAAGTLAVIKS